MCFESFMIVALLFVAVLRGIIARMKRESTGRLRLFRGQQHRNNNCFREQYRL